MGTGVAHLERSMASGVSIEVLDLRHFAAPMLRPLLEAEGDLWRQRLHWDYRTSAKLLMQYLDSHMLPGYVAMEAGQVTGYGFCVYEESKAVIGDVFAYSDRSVDPASDQGAAYRGPSFESDPQPAREVEETLLRHLFETLQNSPHVDRVESQLLLHPSGSHSACFGSAGFEVYRRLFMVQPLTGVWNMPRPNLPSQLELRAWRDEDLNAAGRLIADAYAGHPDSLINDQYRSAQGSLRFLHNIVRYSGCGAFSPQASHVIVERSTRELVALLLGSRVSTQSGHITQLCVRPRYRRLGLARLLLSIAGTCFFRQGVTEISLTVTEANANAIELYRAEGYECVHAFDAAVWERNGI
jgi:ribosomal protein S18 acetylase RimI-like enzyme